MPQLHSASTGKRLPEDPAAPTGGPGRLPATGDAVDAKASLGVKVPLDTSGSMGVDGGRWGTLDTGVSLETLRILGHRGLHGVDGERRMPRTPKCPWIPGCPRIPWGVLGCLGVEEVLDTWMSLGNLGDLRGPWSPRMPRGRWGASEALGGHNCKNGFWSVLENHRFLKKSRKSYQIFRNNSTSQTMKSAQELFYRFWDRAIMTQSITAVFANRGRASAQYGAKKVSHN